MSLPYWVLLAMPWLQISPTLAIPSVAKAGKRITVTEHHGACIPSWICVPGNHDPQSVCTALAIEHSDPQTSQDLTVFLIGSKEACSGAPYIKGLGTYRHLPFSVQLCMNSINYHEMEYSLSSKFCGKNAKYI
jgi:hypothetical protein